MRQPRRSELIERGVESRRQFFGSVFSGGEVFDATRKNPLSSCAASGEHADSGRFRVFASGISIALSGWRRMDMLKHITVVAAAVIVAAVQTSSGAQMPPLTTVMQEKADNAQRLLKPIVLADFAGIEQYAARLGRLTYTEVSSWQDRPDSRYLAQANAFMRAVQDLREASRIRDARKASAAYTGLISSCVNCHQLVQAGRSVSLIPPAPVINPPVSEDAQ